MIALWLAAALTLAPVGRAQAARLATAAADLRLAEAARERGSQARVRVEGRGRDGWSFRGYATDPCLPGQAVCSDLLGRFTVSATGAVRDADVVGAPDLRPLIAYVQRRDECEHWAGEEGFDAARRRQIERAVVRLRCTSLPAERRRLRSRFTDPASRSALRPLYF